MYKNKKIANLHDGMEGLVKYNHVLCIANAFCHISKKRILNGNWPCTVYLGLGPELGQEICDRACFFSFYFCTDG